MSQLSQKAYERLLLHVNQMEDPPGTNTGPVVEWATDSWYPYLSKTPLKWCCGAVCTAYAEAGSEFMLDHGTLQVEKLFQALFVANPSCISLVENIQTPVIFPIERGDIIFFGTKNNLHHVGLVDRYDTMSHIIYTLEGNHRDGVFPGMHLKFYAIGKVPF